MEFSDTGGWCWLKSHGTFRPGASTGELQTCHSITCWPSYALNPSTHMKRFRALGQGVGTFLTSRSTKRILLLAVQSVFLWRFLCRLLQLEHEKRDTDKQRKTERQRKRKKIARHRWKRKKKTQNQTKATNWKKPYKIEVHYVFVYFRNVAKLNH